MAGKTFPVFPAHAQPAILRNWQEAHSTSSHQNGGTDWYVVIGDQVDSFIQCWVGGRIITSNFDANQSFVRYYIRASASTECLKVINILWWMPYEVFYYKGFDSHWIIEQHVVIVDQTGFLVFEFHYDNTSQCHKVSCELFTRASQLLNMICEYDMLGTVDDHLPPVWCPFEVSGFKNVGWGRVGGVFCWFLTCICVWHVTQVLTNICPLE